MTTRWQDIYINLKNNGVDVYSPGVKTGDCTSKYVVVLQDGTDKHPSFSSNIEYYSVITYVPQLKYSELESYKENVKTIMKKLEPMILPTGYESPSFYDDSVKAHMISIQYKNYKKI